MHSPTSISRLLNPGSIAVLGASADRRKYGSRPIQLLRNFGYSGRVYPVSNSRSVIDGLPCFRKVSEIPEPVDLVIISIPIAAVEAAVEDCCQAGVGAIVIYTSGFAEMDSGGAQLQRRLAEMTEKRGVVLCGPNCQGLANFHSGAVSNFSSALFRPEYQVGGLALVGQSGMVGGTLYSLLQSEGIGVGYLVGTGNEAALDASEIASYLLSEDESVNAVVMFLEGIRDGSNFVAAARRAAEIEKPLVVLKVGRRAAGQRGARSHTASLAVDDSVFKAVCRRYGVVRAENFDELRDLAGALGNDVVLPGGGRAAVLSNSGGLAAAMADEAEDLGLVVPALSPATRIAIDGFLPPFVARENPLDVAGLVFSDAEADGDEFYRLLRNVAADPEIDQVHIGVCLDDLRPDHTTAAIATAAADSGKTFIVSWLGGSAAGPARLTRNRVPTFDQPHRSLRLGANLATLARIREEFAAGDGDGGAGFPGEQKPGRAGPTELWTEQSAMVQVGVFRRYGIRAVDTQIVDSVDDALAACRQFPVALKLYSRTRTHKTSVGGVRLSLRSPEQVRAAYRDLETLFEEPSDRILVQPMAPPGVELFAGFKRDPQFGPVVLVGSGGVHVEEWGDVMVLVPPVRTADLESALRQLVVAPLLRDAEKSHPGSWAGLVSALVSLQELFMDLPDRITAFDVNPMIVDTAGAGCTVVDWRLDLTDEA